MTPDPSECICVPDSCADEACPYCAVADGELPCPADDE